MPPVQFLTEKERKYLHRLAEYGDPHKALKAVFSDTDMDIHYKILEKPLAVKYYKKMINRVDKEFDAATGATLKRLRTMTAINLNDIIDIKTGQIRDDVPDEWFDVVKSVRYDAETGAVTQIATLDKLRTLELMMKYQGLLNKKVDVNVSVSIADHLRNAEVSDEDVDALLAASLGKPKEVEEEEVIDVVFKDEDA